MRLDFASCSCSSCEMQTQPPYIECGLWDFLSSCLCLPAYTDLTYLTCLPPEQWMNSSQPVVAPTAVGLAAGAPVWLRGTGT
jgi:hypothetical protein